MNIYNFIAYCFMLQVYLCTSPYATYTCVCNFLHTEIISSKIFTNYRRIKLSSRE